MEIRLLDHLVKLVTDKEIEIGLKRKLSPYYLTKIARLGGYLAGSSDPAPGNMVMWRGLSRLTNIELGAIV